MEIRVVGTPAETRRVVAVLARVLRLRSVSPWLPHRGATRLGRVYLDADPPRTARPREED